MSRVKQTRSGQLDYQYKNGSFGISTGESLTKITDSSSEGENSGFEKLGDKINYFQVDEVRFTPYVLEFIDAFQGKQFSEKFTIQNVGRNPVLVKVGEPNSFVFQLKNPSRRSIFLASGTYITRTVTYTYHSDDVIQKSRIPIYVNGRRIEYPIVVRKAIPDLEIDPPKIDFGTINLGSEVKTLILTIHNKGGMRTKFEVDIGKNDLELVVNPLRGTVKAKHEVQVAVELMGMKEGEFFKEIWIKTNEMPIRVPVLVEVVRPRLLVVYPNGTRELSAIDFPPTFSGTQKAVPFLLKNRGGEVALYVTVGEVNGEYQFLNEARKNNEAFNFFRLTAEEGRLEPHESRVLTALFRPGAVEKTKGWRHQEKMERKPQVEHVVFLTLSRVHCIERKELERACAPNEEEAHKKLTSLKVKAGSSGRLEPSYSTSNEILDSHATKESGFRLCLRGKLVKAEVLLQPSKFYFGEISLGHTEQRVLTITNKSVIRVKCVIMKKMNVNVIPKQYWIGPEKAHDFSVRVKPSCAGTFRQNVKILILGESDVVYPTDEALKVIAEYQVTVSFTSLNPEKVIVPKFGLGITPLITDEVGINKELATFGNAGKVPYAAKLLSLSEEFKPVWMRMKSTDFRNAIMALPNDRPRGFQVWPKDKICRTIFKGWPRYSPPKDAAYAFSSREEIARAENNAMWTNYLLIMREIREMFNQESLACKDTRTPAYLKRLEKFLKSELSQASQLTTPKIKRKDAASDFWDYLAPLSPMFLSYVLVEPKMINYGAVAVDNLVEADLKIKNYNVFPVTLKFIPGNSAVTVDKDDVIVHSDSEKDIKIGFQSDALGIYYGFLNYVINGSHEFRITISAFVMPRNIMVRSKSLLFGHYPPKQAFQPKTVFLTMENWFQASIGYKLHYSADSPYFSTIEEGEVPPQSVLLSEVLVDLHPRKPFTAELLIVSESGGKELVKIGQMFRKLGVKFLTNTIHLGDVPLNLRTKVPVIVNNECFHDVTFEVTDGSPMPGVTVEPRFGVIKARSFFPLNLQIQIPVVIQFAFEMSLIVQTSNRITVKVTGNVVLPKIRINPSTINLRRICAQSFDTVIICVENVGTTPSEVNIDFRTCPEYKVISGSSRFYLHPKQATSVVILFEPKDAARFIFYLPVIVNNILGPPIMQEAETEKVSFYLGDMTNSYDVFGEVLDTEKSGEKLPLAVLNCTVSSSLITVTPQVISFEQQATKAQTRETCEAQDDYGSSYLNFPPKSLVISNDGTKDVTFCLRNDDLGKSNDSPFDLEPTDPTSVEYRLKSMKATLQPGEQLTFKVTFSPQKPGVYVVKVPVYVRGYNNGVVYCYVTLSGKVNKPSLIPDADEVHFCPTPLNVTSEHVLAVTAENFYTVDTISCIICESKNKEISSAQSLSTTWLETPEVTKLNGKQKFQIRICFKSPVPVALRCYLLFVDSNGNFSSVLVTAVADNSSLTTHIYLNVNNLKNKIVRQDCSSLDWKADENPVLSYPFDKATLNKSEKPDKKSYDVETATFSSQNILTDKGPSLIAPSAWSILNVGVIAKRKSFEDSFIAPPQDFQLTSPAPSLASAAKLLQSRIKVNKMDVTYPNYPSQDNAYKKHCDNTLQYVERWIYEVVMRCDQYFMIPMSFKISKNSFNKQWKTKCRQHKDVVDFLAEIYDFDLVQRLEGAGSNDSPIRWAARLFDFYNRILEALEDQGCYLPQVRAEYLLSYEDYRCFVENVQNSDLIKPIKVEHRTDTIRRTSYLRTKQEMDELQTGSSLISTRDWLSARSVFDALGFPSETETDKEDNVDPTEKAMENRLKAMEVGSDPDQFQHTFDVLEEEEFDKRSTQAWLDVIIQIFRHSVLKRIVYKNTIPEVQVIELNDKVPVEVVETSKVSLYGGGKEPMVENYTSNLYSVQERVLLLWLNHHVNLQRKQMWCNIDKELVPADKIINNFQKDLCDSVALISVTASYCPFLVPEYFFDCFPKPDTPDKFYHNAARLVQAWRVLSIGLTVETIDIVKPNNIFMVMLIAQLYEILPALHPKYLVCFECPLSSQQGKKFSVLSDLEKLFIQAKLLGEDSEYFRLSQTSHLELSKGKSEDVKVTFLARKIKKMRATLLLNGCEVSPYFGKSLAFFLEGKLSTLAESEKFSFSAPLYKVICTEIPIQPPYSEEATYDIWYSTAKPELSETSDFVVNSTPWSKICFRKVCRRLFLNACEVTFLPEQNKIFLNVTAACLTRKDRLFWLLFRSKTADFLVRIKIKAKTEKGPLTVARCNFPDPLPLCLCRKANKEIRINWANLKSCPLITFVKVPLKNVPLWNALKTMFLKSIVSQEKAFWAEYFEKDIGLCIIRWLVSPDEEEEVIDEFFSLLQTQTTYTLDVIDSKKTLKMPSHIEVKDVRQETEIVIPVHIQKGSAAKVEVEMTSESGLEVRKFYVQVNVQANSVTEEEENEESLIMSGVCQPCTSSGFSGSPLNPCKKLKKFAKLY